MKKLTKIQKTTIALIILYIIWEIAVKIWERGLPPYDPVIRVDLVLIYPVLGVMIIISLIQLIIRLIKG